MVQQHLLNYCRPTSLQWSMENISHQIYLQKEYYPLCLALETPAFGVLLLENRDKISRSGQEEHNKKGFHFFHRRHNVRHMDDWRKFWMHPYNFISIIRYTILQYVHLFLDEKTKFRDDRLTMVRFTLPVKSQFSIGIYLGISTVRPVDKWF